VTRGVPIDGIMETNNGRHVRLTKAGRRLDQRIEHRLQIEGRAADDLEDVGGSGLLLQGFAQLIKPARGFDRNHPLGGDVLDQLDLLVGEGANLLAVGKVHAPVPPTINGPNRLICLVRSVPTVEPAPPSCCRLATAKPCSSISTRSQPTSPSERTPLSSLIR